MLSPNDVNFWSGYPDNQRKYSFGKLNLCKYVLSKNQNKPTIIKQNKHMHANKQNLSLKLWRY